MSANEDAQNIIAVLGLWVKEMSDRTGIKMNIEPSDHHKKFRYSLGTFTFTATCNSVPHSTEFVVCPLDNGRYTLSPFIVREDGIRMYPPERGITVPSSYIFNPEYWGFQHDLNGRFGCRSLAEQILSPMLRSAAESIALSEIDFAARVTAQRPVAQPTGGGEAPAP